MFGGGHVAGEEIARGACEKLPLAERTPPATASYGSGVYSDRSGRWWDGMECGSQRDGALWLSEVGTLHGRGDENLPQQMAWATVMVGCENSVGASECLPVEKRLR